MPTPTSFAMIHTTDQWLRCAHEATALDDRSGVVSLPWEDDYVNGGEGSPAVSAGLAFDPWCRLYHAVPEAGRIDTLLWSDRRQPDRATPLFQSPAAPFVEPGGFVPAAPEPGGVSSPRGLAADGAGRLFIADSDAQEVVVLDLLERRILAIHPFPQPPVHLASTGTEVAILTQATDGAAALYLTRGAEQPHPVHLPEALTRPGPLGFDGAGRLYLLQDACTEEAELIPLKRPHEALPVPFASSLAFQGDIAVIARKPGADFLRYRIAPGAQSARPHLNALGYDGRGIAIDPTGGVVFWTGNGLSTATRARLRYAREGRVITHRLDSGSVQTRWGRIFLDACIPTGTHIRLRCLTSDDAEPGDEIARTAPQGAALLTVPRPDLSPPLPSVDLIATASEPQGLYLREGGNEMPWPCPDDDFACYEAPVMAPPGRYLWIVADLVGKIRATPKLRSLRAHYPAVDLLRRLPRVFSAEPHSADFLHRYLTMAHSDLDALDRLARFRHLLLQPNATPAGLLPWLGSLLGLEIDNRWSDRATRALIKDAAWLFRYRGTVQGLKRFIEIYLDREIVLVEHFKLRGLGGSFLGETGAEAANSVLGAGFRVGGRTGEETLGDGAETILEDAISTHAHRFSVIVPVLLDQEQRDVIAHILDIHRPAHTVVDLCSVDAGMRAGIGLHLGISSLVGPTSGFGRMQVGGSVLGRRDVIGTPGMAGTVGGARLDRDARLG